MFSRLVGALCPLVDTLYICGVKPLKTQNMDIDFAIVKTTQDLENYALAKLINRNGWGWFESVCGELEEDGIDDLITSMEKWVKIVA